MNARRGFALLAGALLAACSDGPKSGAVAVTLNGPDPVRSVELRVVGPVTSFDQGDATIRFFPTQLGGDTLSIIAIAAQGQTLNGRSLATLQVADKDVARGYATQIIGVAIANYSLQNVADYSVSISH